MKKTNWIAIILMMVIVCASLVGCGSNKPKTDEMFMKNLSAGLEARWKDANTDVADKDNAAYREYLTALVDKEFNKLGAYSDYEFTDSTLGDLAKQYFEALAQQKEGIPKYGIDDEAYQELFTGGYNNRAKLISKFYDSYGLTVKSDYNDDLENMVQLGYTVIKEEEKFDAIQNIVNDQVVLNALGGESYELVYVNSTEYDLKDASITLKFYNESGAEVGNESSYDTVSAGAQSTKKFSLYNVPEFSSVKMAISYRSNDDYSTKKETEFKDITLIDNMKVTIEGKNLPAEVSYSTSYRGIMTTVEIAEVSYEEGYWSDGKCTLSITVKGKKTYDYEGDQSSNPCEFLFKVFDASGNMIDSGNMYASSVMVGDTFNESTYISDLAPGDYTIEFFDYE
jgi:hypothetical protein